MRTTERWAGARLGRQGAEVRGSQSHPSVGTSLGISSREVNFTSKPSVPGLCSPLSPVALCCCSSYRGNHRCDPAQGLGGGNKKASKQPTNQPTNQSNQPERHAVLWGVWSRVIEHKTDHRSATSMATAQWCDPEGSGPEDWSILSPEGVLRRTAGRVRVETVRSRCSVSLETQNDQQQRLGVCSS